MQQVIEYWMWWTDGCGGQFRSRFVNADLMKKAKQIFRLKGVSFEYFEAHDGKNTSDTIGSLVKGAFLRGMAQENEGIVCNAEGVVELMKKYPKPETDKFDFFRIETFPVLTDPIANDEQESAFFPGIMGT